MNSATTTKNPASPLHNQRGGVIGIIMFLLALVGGWYLYQSYTRGQVHSNLKSISSDYKHGINKIFSSGK
jgi:lipopolysaccharide biosynthesis regulator YciM